MIGLFDSGSGGLTIAAAIHARLPALDLVYLGDHAHAPYGHRANHQIVDFTRAGVAALMDRGAELVILACNTAAAIALRTLQQDWLPAHAPNARILGVLVPMVEALAGVPWQNSAPAPGSTSKPAETVLLFATRRTLASGAYRDELAKRAPHIRLVEQACPGLVDAIEGGAARRPLAGLVAGYVAEALDAAGTAPDAAVLGCTHFPLVEDLFRAALPIHTTLHQQPALVAEALAGYGRRHPDRLIAEKGKVGQGKLTLYTTGDPYIAAAAAGRPAGMPDFQPL